jgi:hypothetical protein
MKKRTAHLPSALWAVSGSMSKTCCGSSEMYLHVVVTSSRTTRDQGTSSDAMVTTTKICQGHIFREVLDSLDNLIEDCFDMN